MKEFASIVKRAENSKFYLWLLNFFLLRKIPFNKPHGLVITNVTATGVEIRLPFKKKNLNHIKGLHACGLATLAEYCTGFSLLRVLPPSKYRLIMKEINMKYFYQGKVGAFANFEIDSGWLNENVVEPLMDLEKVEVPCEIKVMDSSENHLATGTVLWQIKDWDKVKTK